MTAVETNMNVEPLGGRRRESSATIGKRALKARRDAARHGRSVSGRREAVRRDATLCTPAWETCGAKARFDTERQARAASVACQFRFGLRLTTYLCPFCGGWHLEREKAHGQGAQGDEEETA